MLSAYAKADVEEAVTTGSEDDISYPATRRISTIRKVIGVTVMLMGGAILVVAMSNWRQKDAMKNVRQQHMNVEQKSVLSDFTFSKATALAQFKCKEPVYQWKKTTQDWTPRSGEHEPMKECAASCLATKGCHAMSYVKAPGDNKRNHRCLLFKDAGSAPKGEWSPTQLIGGWTGSASLTTCTKIAVSLMYRWVSLFVVGTKMDRTIRIGSSKTITNSVKLSVQQSAELEGFSIGSSLEAQTSSSTTHSTFSQTTYHFKPKDLDHGDREAWQFEVAITDHNGDTTIIKTDNVVLTKDAATKPQCFPGFSVPGSDYQDCQHNKELPW